MSGRIGTGARARAAVLAVPAVLAAIGLAGCGSDGAAAPTTSTSATSTPTTAGVPERTDLEPAPEAVEHAGDWPAPGRDLANGRADTGSPITSATVTELAEAWRVDLPGPGVYGNISSTPIVVGDTVIVQDLSSTIRSIDLRSGEVRWVREYDLLNIGPNGPAVGYGKVFAARGSSEIVALDLETGDELWSRTITATESEGVDIQPQVYGGLVFASSVPVSVGGIYAGGDRGVLHALDAETGEVRWTFDTVLGDDLWGDPEVNSGGGAWMTPSIDVATGTIYWGIANPAPFPGTEAFPNGTSRPGPNIYTDSVVALDAATGELRWYHQAVPHDLFDWDLTHTLVVDLGDGEQVVVGTGKLGRVLGLDPATGELRWDTEVGEHRNDDLTELEGPTEVLPGTFGGVLTPPAAADGIVYAAVVNAPSELAPGEPSYLGTDLGQLPGMLVAVDARTGEVVWSVEMDGDPLGGATVAGDLVLTATSQGTIFAFDRATGAQIHRIDAPGGINGWPAAVGDTLLWPVGSADPPALVAYRLGG